MTRSLSRRSLLGLHQPSRPLDRFYDQRPEDGAEPPDPRIPEELHGAVETTAVGRGDAPSTSAGDEIPLPDLQDQDIDEATLRRLAFDIDAAADLIEVRYKGGAQAHAARAAPSLEEAVTALLERRVLGIQLRYRYGGRQWWDTLLRTEGGVRLVRIEQPGR